MAVPNINKQNIIDALRYIDENGVPFHNQSTQYDLVTEDGKKYPPKYVIAVADHLANGNEISVETIHGREVRKFLQEFGFQIETRLEKYTLTISADSVVSTDERFTTEHLKGDNYKVLDAYFQSATGEIVKRNYAKGERRQTNQTMPRLAFQLYEKQIAALSPEEKEAFPICRYKADGKTICGIFSSVEAFRQFMKTIQYLTYSYGEDRKFVIYCWGIFSTLQFVQECLKRFGNPGDQFILTYRDKNEKELGQATESDDETAEWFPASDVYSPGISVEKWKELLADSSVFTQPSLEVIKAFYDIGGAATCSELAKKYGHDAMHYSGVITGLAKRVQRETNCPMIPEEFSDDAKWWTILFVGKRADKDKTGVYIWKLRSELTEALSTTISKEYRNPYSQTLIESKNIILRGAPGTGKSYLAKEIAADIISNGYFDDYTMLTDEQKKQVEFVQFHPSYDYSDFVEGLRPQINPDGTMGFSLQDGVFKRFIARARKNYENSQKSQEEIAKELSAQEALDNFFDSIEFGADTFKTINGNEFTITKVDDNHIYLSIPNNAIVNSLTLNIDELKRMLESGRKFNKRKDVVDFFGGKFGTQQHSYDFVLYNEIVAKTNKASSTNAKPEELKPYIFIIDEINRGEISKIFGELFFAIDPGYRGKAGEVSTQYANLHSNPDEKFYIPENVYIIGTMNDIDRSVDSFDFAMRRRFRFVEIKADDNTAMLASLDNDELKQEVLRRMAALNKEIAKTEELNENYQIGAAYFLKLKTLTFDQLWTDYLQPLLQEYIQGMYDEPAIMNRFAKAYGYKLTGDDNDEADQNQG